MAYAQDTITNVNAADVLAGVIDTLLTAAGWSVVESLTPSGTFRAKVYKSAAGDNAAGYDWYTAVKWNSIGTEQQIEVICGGAYDTGTHSLSQIGGFPSGTGVSANLYAEPITGALAGPVNVNTITDLSTSYSSHGQGASKTWFATIAPSSAFAYWASVTLDHVSLFTTITPGSTGTTANYLASTIDVDAAWAAQPFPVAINPIASYSAKNHGLSATLIGVTPGSINPRNTNVNNVGVALPTLDGEYLPAYAWRDAWYSTGVTATAGAVTFDRPTMGNGFHIGDAIDYYRVYQGSIGDTVTIDGATYVLSGLVQSGVNVVSAGIDDAVYLAVLVE